MIVQKTLLDFPAARETLAIMQGQAEGSKQICCSVYSINQPSRLCSMRRCLPSPVPPPATPQAVAAGLILTASRIARTRVALPQPGGFLLGHT
jgi:hypothetical protein